MESPPQNPEFRINPEKFHQCNYNFTLKTYDYLDIYVSYFLAKTYCTCLIEPSQ